MWLDLLEILADLAADAGNHREAARLFGVADGIRGAPARCASRSTELDYEASVDGASKFHGRAGL